MKAMLQFFKQTTLVFSLAILVVSVLSFAGAQTASAQAGRSDAELDDLMAQLADPDTQNWEQVERQIRTEWSKSGSAAMDLLLQRGEKALEAKDYDAAIAHLTALTDHAPGFAEGWNARATAYFHKQLFGPAMQDIARALDLNPQHFGALTGLAVILQDVGMTNQSQEAWLAVRKLHPHREEFSQALEALDRLNGAQDI